MFLVAVYIFSVVTTVHAQLGRKWDARFGGTDYDNFFKVFKVPDGGYVMGGISESGQDGDKTSSQRGNGDYYIVRTDSVGNKLWDRSYGGSGYEVMFSMCLSNDGGFLLAGHSSSGADGDKTQPSQGGSDYWVVRLDANGNKLWDRRYGGSGSEILMDARPCADGGFILTGYSRSYASGDKSEDNKSFENGWVVRIDSVGNILWEETYQTAADMLLWAGMELPDGSFLFGGTAWPDSTYDISEYGDTGTKSWLIKTDGQGKKIWDKRYKGNGIRYMLPSSNGGAVAVADWSDYLVFKVDSVGDLKWSKNYFGGGSLTGLSATSDGGYIISEYSGYHAPYLDKTEFNLGNSQTWLLKVDSSGAKQWDKTIFTWERNGGYAIESSPGCIVVGAHCSGGVGGYKTQPNWDNSNSTYDFWLLELCEGYIDTTLCPQQPCTGITETSTLQAKLYPNPTTGTFTVELPSWQDGNITLYNLLGQNVFSTAINDTATLQTELPPGVYIYRITQGDKAVNGKLAVE